MRDVLNFLSKTVAADSGLHLSSSLLDGDPSRLLVTLDGYLDTNNSNMFTDAFIKSIDEYGKAKIVVLDIGKLSYVSSTGIGSFVTILAHFKKKNYVMYILRINEKVRSVFDLLGFTSFFQFIQNTSEIRGNEVAGATPLTVRECPQCKKKLKIEHPGKFKCPSCGGILTIGSDGTITG